MLERRKGILQKIPFFSSVSPDDIDKIVNILEEIPYSAGATIVQEGDPGNSFFIVESGLLEVVKSMDSKQEIIIDTIGSNEFFGEMAFIENQPRSATVRAIKKSLLLRLNKDQFEELIVQNPKIYGAIASTLSARLRESHSKTIHKLTIKNLELEKAYRQLKEAQEELIRTEKMAAIGGVSSRVVHDIKNLLTSIQGFAEIIRSKTPESKRFADAIVLQVSLMAEMIQEILDFARGEESVLEFEKFKVNLFINELLEIFKNSIRKENITISGDLNYSGYAWFDEMALRRILHNLVNNAVDALVKVPQGEICVTTLIDGDKYWIIKVKDNGHGIPENISESLFEPFVTQGKSHGTGLGLPICKKLIEAHHGTIAVETEENCGTTFTIHLPIKPQN